MAALRLKAILEEYGISQRALAQAVDMSPAGMTQLVTHGRWPKRVARKDIQGQVAAFLGEAGVPAEELAAAFDKVNTKAAVAKDQDKEDSPMLLRKQTLLPGTRKHFKLFRDPFNNDIQSPEDVFLSGDIRYVREAMHYTARHGGFLAVVGESGSGKSTLRRDLKARIVKDGKPVIVIEPYVLGMEDNDKKGKTLKSQHITESVMAAVAPLERVLSSPEARFRQMHRVLRDSCRAGNSHCLIIEEAHSLPHPTVKHLKRFLELETDSGFGSLISIILIGQPELLSTLSATNQEVREVTQRCEVIALRPLDLSLGEYLKFKLGRAGADMGSVVSQDGLDALQEKLTGPAARRGTLETVSLCYPLAVGNVLTAAMNLAAEIGAPVVNADVVRQV